MEINVMQTLQAKYLDLNVAVRYDEEDMPNDAPLRDGNSWKALINLETATVENWIQGKTLSFYMKICDEGIYILLDKDKEEITRIEGYVPNNLLPGDYGDYLKLDINEDGIITNWLPRANLKNFED